MKSKFDADSLHRQADFAPVTKVTKPPVKPDPGELPPRPTDISADKAEDAFPLDMDGEFGSKFYHILIVYLNTNPTGDLFDEADFAETHDFQPDELAVEPAPAQQNNTHNALPPAPKNQPPLATNQTVTPSKPGATSAAPIPAYNDRFIKPNSSYQTSGPINSPLRTPVPSKTYHPQQHQKQPGNGVKDAGASNVNPSNKISSLDHQKVKSENGADIKENLAPTDPPTTEIPEGERPEDPNGGFYSARAAEALRENPYNAPKTAPAFDPRFDSPSIRKTAGFDHNTSAPVSRKTYSVVPPKTSGNSLQTSQTGQTDETGLDAVDKARRVGTSAVGNAGFASPTTRSPMTTSYRPPTRRVITTRSNATNPAPQLANSQYQQNSNGKRPPLSDMTNSRFASAEENGNNDPLKKSRISDAVGGGGQQPPAAAPR